MPGFPELDQPCDTSFCPLDRLTIPFDLFIQFRPGEGSGSRSLGLSLGKLPDSPLQSRPTFTLHGSCLSYKEVTQGVPDFLEGRNSRMISAINLTIAPF